MVVQSLASPLQTFSEQDNKSKIDSSDLAWLEKCGPFTIYFWFSMNLSHQCHLKLLKQKRNPHIFCPRDNLGSGLPGAWGIKVGLGQGSGCKDGVLFLFMPSFEHLMQ